MIDGSANSQKIIHELDDVMKQFKEMKKDVNLLIFDTASYMSRAGKVLKGKYIQNYCMLPVLHI